MSVTMEPAISGQKLQQEALNNLDFEDYKKQVYLEREKQKRHLQKNPPQFKFNHDYCSSKSDVSNAYLFTGILLIVFAIMMMMIG
jgi:hypothetical protein